MGKLFSISHYLADFASIGIAEWSAELYFYHGINIPNKRAMR